MIGKTLPIQLAFILLVVCAPLCAGTGFTYQGQLSEAGSPANDDFDIQFRLYDAESGGALIDSASANGLAVVEGEFTALLDFGAAPFDGSDRWLELAVRPAGSGAFTTLSPRQLLTPTPYALRSDSAATADVADGALFADTAAVAESVLYQDVEGAPTSPESLCIDSNGSPGVILGGVCLLGFDNRQETFWAGAAALCIARGGDLCSTSQYQTLRTNRPDLFSDTQPVWSGDFSDNDSLSKSVALRSSDDPTVTQSYSYGCCKTVTASALRAQTTVVNGIPLTYSSTDASTQWSAASMVCHARGADLCSKSQYVLLNDVGFFASDTPRLSRDFSDNDAVSFSPVVGSSTPDNPASTFDFAFACCGSQRPEGESCPGTQQVSGLCTGTIHDIEDTNFFDAARACAAEQADICSNSQMQVLRSFGLFFSESWARDGADNDSLRAGGLLGSQPDNPNPANDLFGYACCH